MSSLFRLLAAAAIIYLGVVVFGLPRTSELDLYYNLNLGETSISLPYGIFTMPKVWGAALVILGLWLIQRAAMGDT